MFLLDTLKKNRDKVQDLINVEMNKIQASNTTINDILPFIEESWSKFYEYNDHINKNKIRYENIAKYSEILQDLDEKISHLIFIESHQNRIKVIDEQMKDINQNLNWYNNTIYDMSNLHL